MSKQIIKKFDSSQMTAQKLPKARVGKPCITYRIYPSAEISFFANLRFKHEFWPYLSLSENQTKALGLEEFEYNWSIFL